MGVAGQGHNRSDEAGKLRMGMNWHSLEMETRQAVSARRKPIRTSMTRSEPTWLSRRGNASKQAIHRKLRGWTHRRTSEMSLS